MKTVTKLGELGFCTRGCNALRYHLGDWWDVPIQEFFRRVPYIDLRFTDNVGPTTLSLIVELLSEVAPEEADLWVQGRIPEKKDREAEATRRVLAKLGKLEISLSKAVAEMAALRAELARRT